MGLIEEGNFSLLQSLMKWHLIPKLFTVLKEGYTLKIFSKDLTAGVLVGILSLPMSIAFAIASGVRPEQGLYTGIVAGFLIALFGGSRVQISGPTGAFVILVYSIVQQYGYDGLVVATFMAGILLLVMGLVGLGKAIQFIPYPVTIGFTSGLALVLCTGQVRDLLGLPLSSIPAQFVSRWHTYFTHINLVNPYAFSLACLGILIVIFWPKITKNLPGSLVAIFITTALVHALDLPVETIGSRFGSVPNTLPSPHFPTLSWELITQMISPAIAIALLAGIESLLSAVVADGMTGKRHRSDMELFAQGIGNIASSLFNGIPATGAIARTATNIKNGGQTPVAALVNAATLFCIMLFLGKWVALIPMATLASVLMVVAYNMSEWRHFASLLKSPKQDIAVLLTTFLLTVFVDLTTAIEAGIILAAFLFISNLVKNSRAKHLKESLLESEDPNDPLAISLRSVPEDIEVFEIYGPFFFAATEKFKNALGSINRIPKVLILRMRHVPTIDASGIRALDDILAKSKREKTQLFLSGVKPHLLHILKRSGFLGRLEEKNAFSNIDLALQAARPYSASASEKEAPIDLVASLSPVQKS